MMETDEGVNPLLSKSRASDSRLQVQLHPLVLLTVSDHITRHILRKQAGPVVGAILGSQNGREITMEHAFECKIEQGATPDEIIIDDGWFLNRLQEYKDVHKAPALDFVAWFTLAPPSGPQPEHLPIHNQLLQAYNESALLLTFHPSSVADGSSKGGKLPLAIYETVYETPADGDDDKHMQSSGEAAPQLSLRFQELPYTIETGEAEMIGVDFIASASGNASVNPSTTAAPLQQQPTKAKDKGKGKATTAAAEPPAQENGSAASAAAKDMLTPEDEELIASLTAKANATRMLQQRIRLIRSYLNSLPPCHLNTPPSDSSTNSSSSPTITPDPRISYPILRQISSMLARLPLLNPADPTPQPAAAAAAAAAAAKTNGASAQAATNTPLLSPHQLEQQTQQTDTRLLALLSSLGSTLQTATSLGKKLSVYEMGRHSSMSQTQRRMMQEQGKMPFGYETAAFDDGAPATSRRRAKAPSGGRGGNGDFSARDVLGLAVDSRAAAQGRADDELGDDEGDDDFDEEDLDGDEALQQEEWEEMDEN